MTQLLGREVFIILTVPHATCSPISRRVHDCDYAAERTARKISAALSGKKIKHALLIGDINRRSKDLNRRESRNTTQYRANLTKLMEEKHARYNVFLFDIHSYPGDHEWGAYPVIYLYAGGDSPLWMNQLAQHLSSTISRSTRIFSNIPRVNDIQDEAHEIGVKATLIEFNESNNMQTENQLSSALANWVSTL